MLIKTEREVIASEITDRATYLHRREFMTRSLTSAALVGASAIFPACFNEEPAQATSATGVGNPKKSIRARDLGPARLENIHPAPEKFRAADAITEKKHATTYNNFYELGTGKDDPVANASHLRTVPWSVAIEGEVTKPGLIALEDLLRPHPLEERIYRLRCVEAWSMVIPWIGISLGDLLKRFEPTSKAHYVAFETIVDRENLPGQRRAILDWPYREGLRIDEAMHPLVILAVGMYGEVLPNQNGAPLRLVVPWKYGFKSIKSIVRIRLQSEQPYTSWSHSAPDEYGFQANVNPEVDHPRWSQARERRIGEWSKRPTLPFNGYGDHVASMYSGMNLRKHF